MDQLAAALFASHIALAMLLFFLVNWMGEHAVDFGYVSTTLFEEPNESVALNFFIRALSPAVFIVVMSAIVVAAGYPALRLEIYRVAIYYYLVRAGVVFLLNRHRLVSWPRFIGHALVGVAAAIAAYRYLIIPNYSLLPDLQNAGNELWLAILAFLYAVANKVPLSGGPGARRRNNFIKIHFDDAVRRFGGIIDSKVEDDLLKLITYSVLVYEDYARPRAIRALERLMFWKRRKTTGIMQVSGNAAFSDEESVAKGAEKLAAAWQEHSSDDDYNRICCTIADYNADTDYIDRVQEVMEIIAKRIEQSFKPAYVSVYGQ